MNIKEMQEEILRLKKEKDILILAHAYQSQDILEIADYTGDSFGLSLQAQKAPNKNVLMCGVRFMADTVKVLSPEKHVYLANRNAGCPMAQQMTKEDVQMLKEKYPEYAVVAYINTTTELKTVVDNIVTSSSAVHILKNMPEKDILFIPDPNLGSWVAKQCPEKNIKTFQGGCPSHLRITKKDVEKARAQHPETEILVHPECRKEVTELADYAGSTTGIMKYAQESSAKEFVIGTENSIVQHLQFACPDKKFYPLSIECVCHNMKATTLVDVYNMVSGKDQEEIILDPALMDSARHAIERMIESGK